jgi:hypothetical protein
MDWVLQATQDEILSSNNIPAAFRTEEPALQSA